MSTQAAERGFFIIAVGVCDQCRYLEDHRSIMEKRTDAIT